MDVHVKSNASIPYTFAMGMCEGQLINTIMVMYRIGLHAQVWHTGSNVAAGYGLNEQQARIVVRNAEQAAKRRMGA